jgi:hypothetical protein
MGGRRRVTPDRLTEKKAQRLRFLHALYNATDGDGTQLVDMWELGQELGLQSTDTQKVAEYLDGEGLIEFRVLGGGIAITHEGVVQVEAALSKPDEATQYFPAAINYLHIGSVVGSQIQQGTQQSSISTFAGERLGDLVEFVASLRQALPELLLSSEAKAEAEAEAATLEAQSKSPKPKTSVIRESLLSLRHILEHAAGHAAAVELLTRIGHLVGM